ncbi:DUF5018-related domain-containing protein [Paraflavitalea pollutisoli]|uniref:DUF5018-related domain-containing protein n=1 Tax=Paraflavitalea pollutisoli TaxID=3034143 RepID=UPI0023ED1487|nr:hypothetical protein [Paraflavitalea sp. H1-2-19X]
MKLNIVAILLGILCLSTISCMKPRVKFDDSVWGDNATITAAVLFRYTEVTNNLGYGEPVTGYQNVAVATKSNTIDKTGFTVNIVAVKGTDLSKIGIRFSHYAKLITPLDGAPAAGIIADFTKGKFVYQLTSADGTVRDWTVNIAVEP